MKNLIDELHSLNDEEFKVSASFSHDVMKKIKREKAGATFVKVFSALSCACVIGVGVYFAYNNGVFNRINSAMNSQSVQSINSSTDELNLKKLETQQATTQGLQPEEIDYNVTEESTASDETNYDVLSDTNNLAIEENAEIYKEDAEKKNIMFESAIPNSTQSEAKTYSRQYKEEDYLESIKQVLKDKEFKYTINDNGEIEVASQDFNAVYETIESFVDAEIEIKEETIIIKLK